jgi:hypothetical protein
MPASVRCQPLEDVELAGGEVLPSVHVHGRASGGSAVPCTESLRDAANAPPTPPTFVIMEGLRGGTVSVERPPLAHRGVAAPSHPLGSHGHYSRTRTVAPTGR